MRGTTHEMHDFVPQTERAFDFGQTTFQFSFLAKCNLLCDPTLLLTRLQHRDEIQIVQLASHQQGRRD